MALKVIATATDALVILGLMGGQVKQKDNSNAMGICFRTRSSQ
nr:MAG TPA: hypothetical protein [Bacteriophage sp.]